MERKGSNTWNDLAFFIDLNTKQNYLEYFKTDKINRNKRNIKNIKKMFEEVKYLTETLL